MEPQRTQRFYEIWRRDSILILFLLGTAFISQFENAFATAGLLLAIILGVLAGQRFMLWNINLRQALGQKRPALIEGIHLVGFLIAINLAAHFLRQINYLDYWGGFFRSFQISSNVFSLAYFIFSLVGIIWFVVMSKKHQNI